jgi:excisionase family DNA binding protein
MAEKSQSSHDHKSLAVAPAEAAVFVGRGRTKLYQALNAGVLPSFKIGSRRLVRVVEIETWLQRLEDAARQDASRSE